MFWFLLTLFVATFGDLTADRLVTTEVMINGTHDVPSLFTAYNDTHTTNETCHSTRDIGTFCPRVVAFEYIGALTLFLPPVLGFSPAVVYTVFDASTTKFIAEDVLQADFFMNISTGWNGTHYTVNAQGFRMRDLIVFYPGDRRIALTVNIQDPAAIAAFGTGSFPPQALGGLIFAACNKPKPGGGNYMDDTGFTSAADAQAFINSIIGVNQQCPFKQRSNTTQCRTLHTFSAFTLPSVHCAHVRVDSAVCAESCLPACANCDANAQCVATFPNVPTDFDPVYKCQCNNGYVGNGTSCAALPCASNNCPALWGSFTCGSGRCECGPTYSYSPANYSGNSLCRCDTPSQIFYNNSGSPICVTEGRCIDQQWQCNTQDYNDVKCTMNNWTNPFTFFKYCICNYGFHGGMEYPCVCLSPRRSLYSTSLSSQVCLLTSECTENWHCTWPQVCTKTGGNPIGTCVDSATRISMKVQCPSHKRVVEGICLEHGRCINNQSDCIGYNYNDVKCVNTQCVCNHGFIHGRSSTCECPTGKKPKFSPTRKERLCLAPGECAEHWHCPSSDTCRLLPGQKVGYCAPTVRSFMITHHSH